MKLIHEYNQSGTSKITISRNEVMSELPKEFQEKYQDDIDAYLELVENERLSTVKRSKLLETLKENFKTEIRDLRPELFL